MHRRIRPQQKPCPDLNKRDPVDSHAFSNPQGALDPCRGHQNYEYRPSQTRPARSLCPAMARPGRRVRGCSSSMTRERYWAKVTCLQYRALQSSGNASPQQKKKTRSQEPKGFRTHYRFTRGQLTSRSWAAVRVVAPDSGLHVTGTGGEQVAHGRRCHGDDCKRN
jgi:hypothetical protein